MALSEGTGTAFSTDPHLNDSINEVLSGFQEDAPTGATADPSQDSPTSVESPLETPAALSPGERGDAPPAAASTAADGSSPQPDPTPEPQYEPFTYTVNGEQRTLDGSFRIPGEGLFVPEANVPRWQQIASRADANESQLRDLHDRTQLWDRVTQWTVPGPNGQPQTVSGLHAFEMQRVATDQLAAIVQTYRAYLSDPQKLASLLLYDQGTGAFTIDADRQRMLQLETKDAAREAEGRIRAWIREQTGGQSFAPTHQPTAPDVPIAQQLQGREEPIVTAKLSEWGVRGLTADDVKTLAQQLPRYVHAATKEEVALDPALRLGQPVLENAYEALVRQFAASRVAGASSAQAKTVVDRFNQGQARGRAGQPAQRPVAPPAPVAPPERTKRGRRNERTADSFDTILERGLADPEIQALLNGTAA